MKTDNLSELLRNDNEIERDEDRLEIEVSHRMKEQTFVFFAALGLCCCARAFSSCGEQGLLFIVVHGLLIAVVSLVVEHGL